MIPQSSHRLMLFAGTNRIEGGISGDFGEVDPGPRKKAMPFSWLVIKVGCNGASLLALSLSSCGIYVLLLSTICSPSVLMYLRFVKAV